MHRMGLIPSAHARVPLAPLSEATQEKVLALLEQSPHVAVPV
jgi:dihydrodipicolinate synthase/N-acetylneuraminate lyase